MLANTLSHMPSILEILFARDDWNVVLGSSRHNTIPYQILDIADQYKHS
jgi:hypothetical protein